MSEKTRLKITLVKSTIGFDRKQAKVVQSMGLAGSATPWSCPTRPKRVG